jgi:CheY-like chemotaxis protein
MCTRQPHALAIDEPVIVELMRELLEEEGFRVSTRADLFLDLNEIKSLQPNVLVTDFFRAGRSSGWSWIGMLRSDPQLCTIPVVLCTAAAGDVESLATCLGQMNVVFVRKPFEIDVLLSVVRSALPPLVMAGA